MFYRRDQDLANRYIISISLMTTDMFYGRHHDLGNHYIIYISLMTTDMLYGRHHDLVNRYIISITLMTTDMFYGRHHDLGNHYIISISLMNTCSVCRDHSPIFSSFITYYQVYTNSYTPGATSGAGTANHAFHRCILSSYLIFKFLCSDFYLIVCPFVLCRISSCFLSFDL